MNFLDRASLGFSALLALASAAQASDGLDLSTKSRSLAAASSTHGATAPFVARARDPLPELMLRDEREGPGQRGGCEHSARDLCYERSDGRFVYRPAREFMPRIDGLTPESVSLRHNRLILRYSFR